VTIQAGEDDAPDTSLPDKYTNSKMTSLQAKVREGVNELDFDLQQ
jgi:hypothetical protein